ncbi:MAG: Rho termination protein, partial [Rubripirellula sp.]|nr:Rho termination protein [Rubripirellula sp.]
HWSDIAEDYERIYSLSGGNNNTSKDLRDVFEDRLSKQMPSRGENGQSIAEPSLLRQAHLPFDVDAELIVFGKTVPSAVVSVAGRPVKLRDDGSFTVRMELPDRRQVLPVTAESGDGSKQRTTVIAVERNTKVMEPEDRF